jgi:hypothetical protein
MEAVVFSSTTSHPPNNVGSGLSLLSLTYSFPVLCALSVLDRATMLPGINIRNSPLRWRIWPSRADHAPAFQWLSRVVGAPVDEIKVSLFWETNKGHGVFG